LKTNFPYFWPVFALFVGVSFQANAQTINNRAIEKYVIGSAVGGVSDTAKEILSWSPAPTDGTGRPDVLGEPRYLIEWTIGEIMVEALQGSKKRITQGFHQDFWGNLSRIQNSSYIFSVLDQEDIEQHFSVFPNPFVSNVSVKWEFDEDLNLWFEVYALDGRRIFHQRQNANTSQLLIQLNNLKPSTYILRISDPARGFLETHKIIKL
jgi:hypothetical protein